MNTSDEKQKRVIVVLGAGRTGTSLLAKILASLGMDISDSLRPAAEHNPDGIFEDDAIVKMHVDLLSKLGNHAYLPLEQEILKEQGVNRYISQLREIVLDNIGSAIKIWGFKDPRTPSLLPLWMRVFNTGKITPTYILSVRDPRSAVESMHKQYGDSYQIGELVWLYRNCEALYHTGANCFLVHYEDWFTDQAPDIAKQLLRYTDLDEYWDNKKNITETITDIVKPNLNRAIYNDYNIENRYVMKLYDQLSQCKGDQFDRQALMDVVMECRKAMNEFSGWAVEAQRFFKQKNMISKKEIQTQKEIQIKLRECIDLRDEYENSRIRLSVQSKDTIKSEQELKTSQQELKNQRIKLKRKEERILALQASTSYQIGNIFVKAFTKPGKNTILFPFYVLRVLFASRAKT